MIKITSLGGSGEDSRNCFLLQSDEMTLMLDCGVRREIAEVSRVYPLMTKEIAEQLDGVILSHAHEDHTAALPYLYELGYHGPVYADPETIALTPPFLKKWKDYVIQHGGSLPFSAENIDRIRFSPLSEFPFPLTCGRSGHIIGGRWFCFRIGDKTVLYTGDLTYDSLLLDADPLPQADILIIDSAYAGQHLNQREQYAKLRTAAEETFAQGGKLMLPVPANGRGIDMFIYLSRCGLPVYAAGKIVRKAAALAEKREWIKPFAMPETGFTVLDENNRREMLNENKAGVYLFGDGMMTNPVSAVYFNAIKDDSRSRILITGHSAKGTLANNVLQPDYIRLNGIRCSAEQLTIKVHNDEDDVLALAAHVHPSVVMLFHSNSSACTGLIEKLTRQGIRTVCGTAQPVETD